MAATKLQSNWTAVSFNSAPISRVTQVSFTQGGTLTTYAADGDHFPTVIVNTMSKPKATVASGDVAALMAIAPGVSGTFSATHKDAKGEAGGDILYVLANAVAENSETSGAHGEFGTATLTLMAYSSDGTTNPLSFTRA